MLLVNATGFNHPGPSDNQGCSCAVIPDRGLRKRQRHAMIGEKYHYRFLVLIRLLQGAQDLSHTIIRPPYR